MDQWTGIDAFCEQHKGQQITVDLMGMGEKHTVSGELMQVYPDSLLIKERYRTIYVAKQAIAVIYEAASSEVTSGPRLY